jgi:hypothetical protein
MQLLTQYLVIGLGSLTPQFIMIGFSDRQGINPVVKD